MSPTSRPDCPRAEALGAFIDGSLDGAELAAVTAHVGRCAECHSIVVAAVDLVEAPAPRRIGRVLLPLAAAATVVLALSVAGRHAGERPGASIPSPVTAAVADPSWLVSAPWRSEGRLAFAPDAERRRSIARGLRLGTLDHACASSPPAEVELVRRRIADSLPDPIPAADLACRDGRAAAPAAASADWGALARRLERLRIAAALDDATVLADVGGDALERAATGLSLSPPLQRALAEVVRLTRGASAADRQSLEQSIEQALEILQS